MSVLDRAARAIRDFVPAHSVNAERMRCVTRLFGRALFRRYATLECVQHAMILRASPFLVRLALST